MPNKDWFQSSLGLWLIEQERASCNQLVPDGYYPSALQLGLPNHNFLEGIEIGTRFQAVLPADSRYDRISHTAEGNAANSVHQVRARSGALPFSDKAHSLIVLPHVLDSAQDPHAVLREVNQILIPEGCLVMTGFNPLSLWRMPWQGRRRFSNAPSDGHYYRVRRVQDWLSLLGFDIVGGKMLSYSPPVQNEKWRNRFGLMEKMGDRWWPALGASWIVVARKREIATSSGSRRRAWQRFIPAIARPAVSADGLRSAGGANRAGLRLVASNYDRDT